MTERERKAFDFAQELTKQLLTLSTGVLALTITFRKDIVAEVSGGTQHWLEAAWIAYLVSAGLGVMVLGALAGNLHHNEQPSIYAGNIRWTLLLQQIAFVAAVVLTIVFAVKAL